VRASRSWIFLVIGVVLAVATGIVLYQIAASPPTAQATVNGATVSIVVATADIAPRTVIAADVVTMKAYPTDLVPPGALTGQTDAVGATTSIRISKGQPVLRDALSAASPSAVSSSVIPAGKVMVAFPTNDPLTTAGLVSVGDRVDLLATVVVGTGEGTRTTQTTLQNLDVAEVILPTKEQPQRVRSLVFVVDHQVALVLKYLRDAETTVDLTIRSRAETALVKTTKVDLEYLVNTYEMKK